MPHRRFRTASGTPMVRAGARLFLAAQTGHTFDGAFPFPGDPGGQAEQALRNAASLLATAGATLADIGKLTIYVTDRAWLAPVEAAVARQLGAHAPARTTVIVAGLVTTEALVAIEIDAVVRQ